MSGRSILEVRTLGKRFGGLRALSDVSFAVAPGEIIGVIGPNGAGKSTLVDLVTGHVRPTAGVVVVDGRDVTGAKPWAMAAAGVARTFQIVKPFWDMTARENVAVGLMYGRHRVRARTDALRIAEELLDKVGFAAPGSASPAEVTVADMHRLELAKALALSPRLLLIDEIMAGLRPDEIAPCVALIQRLRDEGTTILAVEHVLKAILSISDRVLVLHEGRMLAIGEPYRVLSDPRVVEAYLGPRRPGWPC